MIPPAVCFLTVSSFCCWVPASPLSRPHFPEAFSSLEAPFGSRGSPGSFSVARLSASSLDAGSAAASAGLAALPVSAATCVSPVPLCWTLPPAWVPLSRFFADLVCSDQGANTADFNSVSTGSSCVSVTASELCSRM